jgi:type IV secretion system protein VirD4
MVSRQETSRPLLTPGEVMQLPPSDELVLVSGLSPIRAAKLRHYEDRNFTRRLLPAPELASGSYADAPPARGHDWVGFVRRNAPAVPVSAEPSGEGDGGLQQARQPELPSRRRKAPAPEQLDLLGLGDDEGELLVADPRNLNPVIAAHAANQGGHRGDELVPSF